MDVMRLKNALRGKTIAEFRAGLIEEASLYRGRGPEVERLNRGSPPCSTSP